MSSKSPQNPGSGESPSKVKAACEECRTRKTKCDGARPTCGRCLSKGRVCVYETEPDEFRITALKRRYTELAQSAFSNEALIQVLREKGHDEAVEILERLRSDESVGSILSRIVTAPEHEAERNLMKAVEEARISDQADSSQQNSSSQDAEEDSPPHRNPPQTLVNKQSIAFLVGTPGGSQAPSTPASPELVSQPSTDNENLNDEQARPRSPYPRQEKRTRTSEPSRPALHGHTFSAPAIRPKSPRNVAEALTRRLHSKDRTWTKELDSVKAADWEVYYCDDETFLDILRCYFTWENPSLGFVNEAAFWEGLKTDGSDFCNRPLVHSVLAFGSKIYSMFNPARAASATHFALVEVTKLWDWDADATVPANASTGLLIHAIMTSNGKDKDGSPYIAGAMNLALSSPLFSKDRIMTAYPDSDSKLSRERAAWAWNTYAYHGYYTLTFNEASMISEPPPVSAPDIDPNEDVKEWSPFPLQGASRAHLTSSFSRARARLWQVGSKIRPLHQKFEHDSGSESHWKGANDIYRQLSDWRTGLSTRLNVLNGAAPHVFTLHSEYHRCMIDLWRPFVSPLIGNIDDERSKRAQQLSNESHIQLRSLLHTYDVEFPGMPLPLKMLLNPLLYVVNETLPSLSSETAASGEAFHFDLCIRQMCRMQDAYPLMRFLILDIQQIAEQQGVKLSEASEDIVKALRKGRSATLPLNSAYPGHQDHSTTAVEGSHLQRMTGSTRDLSLSRFRHPSDGKE